jgi:DNA-binding XRE family transcriptional regulator
MTMRTNKSERLRKKGWRFGSAAEFLGLSYDEQTFIAIRLKLADAPRKRRTSHGVTQTMLARALKSSQSRVAKMEAGDPTMSLDLLIRSLLALGASNRELASVIARR